MGICQKLWLAAKEWLFSMQGQNFDGALSVNQNLPYDLLFDFGLVSA